MKWTPWKRRGRRHNELENDRGLEVDEHLNTNNFLHEAEDSTFSHLFKFGSIILIGDKITGEGRFFQGSETGIKSMTLSPRNFTALSFIGAKIAELQRINDLHSLGVSSLSLNLGGPVKMSLEIQDDIPRFELFKLVRNEDEEKMCLSECEFASFYNISTMWEKLVCDGIEDCNTKFIMVHIA